MSSSVTSQWQSPQAPKVPKSLDLAVKKVYIAYVEFSILWALAMAKRSRPDPRLSHQTLRVLKLFLDGPKEGFAGSDIWKALGLFTGTVYPILLRLESAGWLKSEWEKLSPEELGRPRKRVYQLTPNGYNRAREALAELDIQIGRPSWKY